MSAGHEHTVDSISPGNLHTCQNCQKAKIRCDRGPQAIEDGSPCIRCKRLKKVCHVLPARRRRNNAQRDARIETLESTIGTLLKGRAANYATPVPNILCTMSEPGSMQSANLDAQSNNDSRMPMGCAVASHAQENAVIPRLIGLALAETLLNRFRSEMVPQFPFVVIPQHISASTLNGQSPWLLMSIMAVASYDDVALQRRLGRDLAHRITQQMLGTGTVSFELLQALLVYLAWTQYHPRPKRYSQYLQLAISIVIDLRLDRHPDTRPWKARLNVPPGTGDDKDLLSLDEQRAVAGCHYLSASISRLMQKHCTLSWSAHVEECCQTLLRRQQYSTDRFLYHCVQVQHVMEQADAVTCTALTPSGQPNSQSTSYTSLTTLRSSLDLAAASSSFSLRESPFLVMQHHTAELYIAYVSISSNATSNMLPTDAQWPQWRLDCLSAALLAAKSLIEYYLSLPLVSAAHHNNTEWLQIWFALTLALRLTIASQQQSLFEGTAHLQPLLDVWPLLNGVAERMAALVTDKVDDDGDHDAFHHVERRINLLKTWFEAQSCNVPTPTTNLGADIGTTALQMGMSRQSSADISSTIWAPAQSDANPVAIQTDFTSAWMTEPWLGGTINLFHWSGLDDPYPL